MIKTSKHLQSFSGGVDSDTAFNKYSKTTYLDATNMRIITNDANESGAATSVKGNILKLSFPTDDVILGFCKIRNNYKDLGKDSIVFFTLNTVTTRDRIYLLEGDPYRISGSIDMDVTFQVIGSGATAYKVGYIYQDDALDPLNFSIDHPIKAEGRYESENIRKVYWTDNYNNIRYMILDNVKDTDLTTIFELNPSATLTAPVTTLDSGGAYNSGVVQHAYQLYIKNGARTTFSPCSNLVALSGNDSSSSSDLNTGTGLGVNTGKSCIVTIPDIDTTYNRIRIVAIYYTQLNIEPLINIVGESDYDNTVSTFTFVDNGYATYGTIPLEEFRLIGQTDYKADSLASKNNYLFFGSITKSKWNPTWLQPLVLGVENPNFWDSRAVRFRTVNTAFTGAVVAATNYTMASTGFTITRTADTTVHVSIASFQTNYVNVGGITGRTVTAVTAVATDITGSNNMIAGTYTNTVPITNIPYTGTPLNTVIQNVAFGGGALSFNVYKATGFFNLFASLTTCNLYSFKFTYSYTADVITSTVTDSDDGPLTITQPTANTIVAWDTAGWDTFQTAYNHDAVNSFNDIDNDDVGTYEYKYQYNGSTLGASGKNIEIEFATDLLMIDNNTEIERVHVNSPFSSTAAETSKRSSMRNEVYRNYIVFYNTKMQFSNPQWICDLRMPTVTDSGFLYHSTQIYGRYIYPKITIYNLPADDELLGWQIFRCERKNADKSIIMRGLVSPVHDDLTSLYTASSPSSPYIFLRAEDITGANVKKDVVEFVAPEITFNKDVKNISGDILRIEGRYSFDDSTSTPETKQVLYWLKTRHSYSPGATDTLIYTINDSLIFSDSTPLSPTYSSIDSRPFKHDLEHTISGSTGYSKTGTVLLLHLNSDLSIDLTTTNRYLLAAYMRNIHSSRYGGITYEARSYNQVIPYSALSTTLTDGANLTCYYGDTFIHFYTYLKGMFFDGGTYRFQTVVNVGVETTIDLFHRLDPIQKYITPYFDSGCKYGINEKEVDGITSYPTRYPVEIGDLYRQNSVYSQQGNAQLIQCKVFDSSDIDTIDTEILATGIKVNNEYFDNWTNVYTNNTLWLDPKYGPIRNLFIVNNTLFAGQDKAIAQVSVQERSMIQDSSQRGLVLGTGDVLARYDYLTTTSGFQNYYDMVLTDKSFYYVDRRNKIIYGLTGEGTVPISEIKGYRSYLKSFGKITTVKSGYDPIFKEILFYISDGTQSSTSVLNEYMGVFIGKYSFIPDLMFSLNDQLYSITAESGYHHNEGDVGSFYGVYTASDITVIINPSGNLVCRFDVADLRVDVKDGSNVFYETEQFDSLVASTNYQSITKTLNFGGEPSVIDTEKTITRQWRVWLIPDDLSSDVYRLADTYCKIKLSKDNDASNKRVVLHDIMCYFRPVKN